MRVLFSSTFGFGHNYPMVPLAVACAQAGHEVLWATSEQARALVEEAGLRTVAAGLSGEELQERLGPLQQHVQTLPGAQRAAFMFPSMFGATLTPPMAADLLAVAGGWRPDLLVHEHGELASPLVGAVLGIPSVTHSFGGAVPPAFLTDAGDRVAALWEEHGLRVPPYAGCFTSLYLDICPPDVQMVPTQHIPAMQPLRPVAWTGPDLDGEQPWLRDTGRPLVYLTLGTVQRAVPVLQRLVQGLAALPVRLLVTVGPEGDPAALGPTQEQVWVERFVPQTQVLGQCAVVASHAGSGTFLGALAEGVPQLCLPQAADQFRNAAGAVRCGAGLSLAPEAADPEAVVAAVERLLAEESFAAAARRQAEVIEDMPAPVEVVGVLERLP